MLSSDSVLAVLPYAQHQVSQGQKVTAAPGSLLEKAAGTASRCLSAYTAGNMLRDQSDVDLYFGDDSTVAVFIEQATSTTSEKASVANEHTRVVDALIDQIAEYVKAHVDFARNTVNPQVKLIDEAIDQHLQTFKTPRAMDSVSLVEYDIPTILKDEMFLKELSPFENRPLVPADRVLNFPVKAVEEIRNHLLTGQKDFDEEILTWSTHLGDDILSLIWLSFFSRAASSGQRLIRADELTGYSIPQRIDIGLCVYLICNSLKTKVESTADSISLPEYNRFLDQAQEWAATLMMGLLKTLATYQKVGTLVIYSSAITKTIVVLGSVYERFLQEGGTPEAVLGLMTGNQPRMITVSNQILAQKAELEASWASYEVYYTALQANKSIEYFREFLMIKMRSLITGNTVPSLQAYKAENAAYEAVALKRLKTYVDGLKMSAMQEPRQVSLYLGAQVLFYYTDAYKILAGIQEAAQANPSIDVREAALLSTVAYVADYLADQIVLVK